MKRLFLCGAALAAVLAACSTAEALTLDRTKFMSVAEVRPGMKAIGKSVFKGTKIESFNMEILAVLPRAYRGRDAVLAKILDGPVVERQTGLIAGMSGSPVFVGGRLLGAIAFGWSFTKEPLAGITPIEYMLAPPESDRGQPSASVQKLAAPIKVGGKTIRRVVVEPGMDSAQGPTASDTLRLAPMGGLVLASGFSRRSREKLEEVLKPFDLSLAQGLGSQDSAAAADLQPGGTLTIQLMSGDFSAYALGTVTWRDGDKVYGFGHPFLGIGKVDLPLSGGVVQEVVPSLQASMKLGSTGKPVGTISSDTLFAVSGSAAKRADSLPVELTVAEKGQQARSYHVQVARDKRLTPGLLASAALQAVDQTWGYVNEGTALVALEMKVKGRPVIQRSELVFSSADAAAGAASQLVAPMGMFMNNDFGSVDVESVTARIELQEAQKTATLERVIARADQVKADEDLVLDLVLRPYRGEAVTRTVSLHIPRDAPSGVARIVATGGSDAEAAKRALGVPPFVPYSLDDIVDWYGKRPPAHDLVVQVALPSIGVDVLGRDLPRLPRALIDVMRAGKSSAVRPRPDLLESRDPTDWVVSGRQLLTVIIEGRPGVAPPKPIRPPAGLPGGPPQPPGAPGAEPSEEESLSAQWMAARSPEPTRAAQQKSEEKEEATKPLARAPEEWVNSTKSDFEDGKLNEIAVDSRGRLTLSRGSKTLAELPRLVPFSLLAVKDTLYVGTGNEGVIYSVDKDGKVEPFFRTGESIVHSLAADGAGNIYAGTSPNGIVFRISPDGKGTKFFESGQHYAWCLSFDEKGNLLVGTGVKARVYRLDAGGHADLLAEPAASHVFCLAPDGKGGAWVGTGNTGVVYRVENGAAVPVLDANQEAILSIARDDKGNVYAGSSPKGIIYRIDPQGRSEEYFDTKEDHVFALAPTAGGLLAATGNDGLVFRIEDEDTGAVLLKPEVGQAISMTAGSDGSVFVAYGSPGLVRRLEAGYAKEGTYESEVLDPGDQARWGRMSWVATTPEGAQVAVQTRSGETLDPDDRWSPWSAPLSQGELITSPAARYLQYRITMKTADGESSPALEQLSIVYRARNQRPQMTVAEPKSGESLSKKVKVSWKAKDPDGDTLVYDLLYSPVGEQKWESIKADLKETSYEWDVSKVKDGQYLLKVVASDRQGNPDDPLSKDEVRILSVDNTPPTVLLMRHSIKAEEGTINATGVADDEASRVEGVDWKVDSGEWQAASMAGQFDLRQATFTLKAEKLSPGKHEVEVRAFDGAGNMGTDKTSVEVPAPKPEKQEEAPAKEGEQAAEKPAAQPDE